jgi:hypothetical protein
MRVNFDLKIYAQTYKEAKLQAYQAIANFLSIPIEGVPEMVDVELRVTQVKEKDAAKYSNELEVSVFANVKQSVFKPFNS